MGCGGKVTFVEGSKGGQGGEGGGAAALDCADVSFDFDQPISMCGGIGAVCSITGVLPNGHALRETCAADPTPTCALFVDNVKVCTCPADQIDFANQCGNGVPTCFAWKVDYGDVTPCP